ncbi:MAG: PhzF family phenazine biosynthesis protein [Sphingomonas sp.]
MKVYDFQTIDVFASHRFGGNQLAVFTDARGLRPETMQNIAHEMNLSETAFVLPPDDPANDCRVRIFNRTAEMAFAGHPTIGTAVVLGRSLPPETREMVLEVPAGLVRVALLRDGGSVTGARVVAPRSLELGETVPAGAIAACLRVPDGAIAVQRHPPIHGSMGNPYVIVELTQTGLAKCSPDPAAFRAARSALSTPAERFSIYAYHRQDDIIGARMFAPLAGTWEDAATGSAAAPLAGLLLSLDAGERRRFTIFQGEAMGRPSRIDAEAWRDGAEIRASIEGRCVPVFRGSFAADESD